VHDNLFDRDFLRWTETQASLLRDGRLDALDCGNLIDVLEGIGREERLAVQTAFRNILVRLLKLAMSPARGDRIILVESITEHRNQLQTRLESTPSLMRHAPELFERAWCQARRAAEKTFEAQGEPVEVPQDCPFSMSAAMDVDFLPGLIA